MASGTKGTANNLGHWLRRIPPESCANGEFRLLTRGVGDQELVTRWPGALREHPEDLAEDVVQAAQSDCDLRQTDTAYSFVLVDAEERVVATLPMRRRADDPSTVEEGSLNGIIAQVMRHNEAMMRMTLRSQEATINQSLQLTSLLAARVSKLEEERVDLLETEADAIKAAQVDEVAAKRAEVQDRRARKLEELLERLAVRAMMPENAGGKK